MLLSALICIFKHIFIGKSAKYLVFSFLFLSEVTFSQDIHFSQFDGSLLNITPAFTGMFNGDFRASAIYRSQWQSVPVPYSTLSMSGEALLKPARLEKDMVGVGLTFNNDVAGDARYGTTQIYASGSYIHALRKDSSLFMSMGANLGFCRVGFDYDKMTFDNQFDGTQYASSAPTGERFNLTNYNYGDINLGAAVQYRHKYKHFFTIGTGLMHLNNPVITYQGNQLSRLDFKTINYIKYSVILNLKVDLIVDAMINGQGKYLEIMPHSSVKYYFNRDNNKAILGGLSLRARDAVILRLGYHDKMLQSGIAYDINVSNFTPATNRRGAFELFVIYVFKKEKTYTVKKRVCPVFM
ncbi:MAG: PorP/SprF family type IX secretion system membrane protein [Sphingobacteriaceae bacterium]|nr:PorP/SprF family type IX secretion system membrane protein [Sphingobacteriaceae bacterium]